MSLQILLHFLLAFIWMFLNDSWVFSSFAVGFLLGLGMLYLFLGPAFYFRRVYAIWKLFVIFLRELVKSSWSVIRLLLQPRMDIHPGIFAMPTRLVNDWEVTLLAGLITLTPGTLTIDISPDRRTLYIHAMDLQDTEATIMQIQNSFEKAIMEVTR